MILTLTIKLVRGFCAQTWKATLEIDESAMLEDLHQAIQKAVEFDNDHLYEFYIARTYRSRDRVSFDDENEGLYEFTINSIFPLEEGKKCFYLFDYGDNWLFQITPSQKNLFHRLQVSNTLVLLPSQAKSLSNTLTGKMKMMSSLV